MTVADKIDLDALEALFFKVCHPAYEPAVETSVENWHRRIQAAEDLTQFHNAFPALLAELREARAIRARLDVEAGKKFKHDGGTVGWWDQGEAYSAGHDDGRRSLACELTGKDDPAS